MGKEEHSIAFIDTPGHEAFSEIRYQGSRITDILVLVVAATSGVQQQTVEVIEQALENNVTVIVAINKIDLPNADPASVKRQLARVRLLISLDLSFFLLFLHGNGNV